MANYAENLIGKWETEQYEPLRQVAQERYNTNWDKLSSDYNNLTEQLAQNFKSARKKHNEDILENATTAYNTMYNAEKNLASRGLTGSGLMNVYNTMNTENYGKQNDVALEELMNANKANAEGSMYLLNDLAKNSSELSNDLGDTLAGITDAEGDNMRQYRDLVASISESAADRNAKYGKSKVEEELDDIYQLIAINDILSNEETDDSTKYSELLGDAGVSPEQAEKILSSYNYNKTNDKIKSAQEKIAKANKTQDYYKNLGTLEKLFLYSNPITNAVKDTMKLSSYITKTRNENKIKDLNKELSEYTYEDLRDIMGY